MSRLTTRSTTHSLWSALAAVAGAVLLGLIVHNARYGAVSPRIRNPNDTGGSDPLSDPLFGYGHWIVTIELFSYLALISIVALIVVLWRRHPGHPYLHRHSGHARKPHTRPQLSAPAPARAAA